MFRFSLCILLCSFALFSCDNTGKKSNPLTEDEINPVNIQKGGKFSEFSSVQDIRNQARTLLNYRIENGGPPLSMITYAWWYPEVCYNEQKFSKELAYVGHWLKFEEDFSYTYGIYDRTTGGGRYHYRLDDSQLIMLDNDPEMEPKVWDAKNNGEIMPFVGTHTFDVNNGMQIKMIPLDERPTVG